MKEISKSNFLSLGQTTGILNLPSSVVATPARKVLSGKVNKRTAAYPTGCFVSLSTTRPAKLPLPDCALTVIPDHNKTT